METDSFETLTRDSFEALETRQVKLVLEQLDAYMVRLEEMDQYLSEYLHEKETVPLR